MSSQPIDNPIKAGEAGMPQEVYALLAQANLLRIRGNWQEAIDKCMDAMRLVPNNSAAQSLLGDIYENQGRMDEAIQWYQMALDSNPGSPADKQKLARLLALRDCDEAQDDHIEPAVIDTSFPSSTIAKSNLLRATAMICGVCLIGFALTAVMQSHGQADAKHAARASTRVSSADQVYAGQVSTPGETSIPRDPFEVGLSNSLSATDLPVDMRFADVIADPRNGRLTLTYVVRPIMAIDRETVLRNALRAAESASKAPDTSTYPYFTIRILLSADDLVTSPDSGSLIFIGDIGRADIVDFPTDVSSLSSQDLSGAFTNQWWAPSLNPPASAPAPSTPVPPAPALPSTTTPQMSQDPQPAPASTGWGQ